MDFNEPFGGVIPGAQGAVLAVLLRTGEPLTGRQVHGLLSDDYSLWSVQEALKTLATQGVVATRTVGRAGVHTINDDHAFIQPLRVLVDPVGTLKSVIDEAVDAEVRAVILFGSIARGEATADSDVDLAVIASEKWDHRAELQDRVEARLGNGCDVLVFTPDQFKQLMTDHEPVVDEILHDGVALIGSMPRRRPGAA